jgi:hypothetical protein
VRVARQSHELLEHFRKLALGWIHVRIDRAGLHVVDRDAARAEIARESLDEPLQRRLAHCIHRAAGERHALRITTADIDDAPAGLHVLHRCLRGDEDGTHVDRDRPVKVSQLELVERDKDADPRVV